MRKTFLVLFLALPANALCQGESSPSPNIGESGRIKMKKSFSMVAPSAAWTTSEGTVEVEWSYSKLENPRGDGSYFRLDPVQISYEEKLFNDPKKPKRQTDILTLKLQKGVVSASANVGKEKAQGIVDQYRSIVHLCKTSISIGQGPPEQFDRETCHFSELGILFVYPSQIPPLPNPPDETVAIPHGLSIGIKVKEATEPRIVWQAAGEDKRIRGECHFRLNLLSGTVTVERKTGRLLSAETRVRFAGEFLARPPDREQHSDISLEFIPDVETDPPK